MGWLVFFALCEMACSCVCGVQKKTGAILWLAPVSLSVFIPEGLIRHQVYLHNAVSIFVVNRGS